MRIGDWVYVYENENHIECKNLGKFYLATIRKVNTKTVVADVILNEMDNIETFEVPKKFVGESK